MVDPIYEPGFETEDNDSKKENKESKKNGKDQDGERKDGDRKNGTRNGTRNDGDRKEGRDGECSATTRTTYIIVDGSSEEKKEGKSLERFA
tara:strand:+ start:172 stop:444 length:273 start_codon:yes stop_codon:yes gene_type:complete